MVAPEEAGAGAEEEAGRRLNWQSLSGGENGHPRSRRRKKWAAGRIPGSPNFPSALRNGSGRVLCFAYSFLR